MAKPKIALFQNHPECSRQCYDGMDHALSPHYNVIRFGTHDTIKDVLSDAACVAFPGGIGDSDSYYKFFKRRHGNAVADFVAGGGKYLGICMGQYWAGSNYFDILEGCDIEQYITRPNADVRRSYGTVASVQLAKPGQISPIWHDGDCPGNAHMFFYDGGAVVGNGPYDVHAWYTNGDPMAIIQNNVGIVGCHPESEESWYDIYPYIKTQWHRGEHHTWLLEFVDKLIQ